MSKILCILDGFGLTPASSNNAPALAKMPNFKYLLKNYFWTTLNADGANVGQEEGLVGNSEVGHMNIGGLKLVPQLSFQITKSAENIFDINREIAPDQLFDPKRFLEKKFSNGNKTVHLTGLFSKGQIHSDLRHWAGAIETAGKAGAEKIVLHIISDGRDSDRQSLVATWEYFIKEFGSKIKPFEDKIFLGSLGGRFYAMDRDNNWERVYSYVKILLHSSENVLQKLSQYKPETLFIDISEEIEDQRFTNLAQKYSLQVMGIEEKKLFIQQRLNILEIEKAYEDLTVSDYIDIFHKTDLRKALDELAVASNGVLDGILNSLKVLSILGYEKNIFDEYLEPTPLVPIQKDDTVWMLNFRTDRMKELTQVLSDANDEFDLGLDILGMNDYCIGKEIYLNQELEIVREKTQKGYHPVFKNQPVVGTLAEYISNSGKTQLHIAETEKYNHVTYFMNGGQNKKWDNETWEVIDSNKVNSHAEKPEMKAKEVTDFILENGLSKYDYILVNYANPDMVGHTGDINAAITTMEFLDQQLGRLIKACEEGGHEMIITADHGNVEKVGVYQYGDRALIDTEHNPNFVPLILLSSKFKIRDSRFEENSIDLLLGKAQSLIDSSISNPDMEQLKKVLNQNNQVDLSPEIWLEEKSIPAPLLPLWYTGLLLLCI